MTHTATPLWFSTSLIAAVCEKVSMKAWCTVNAKS